MENYLKYNQTQLHNLQEYNVNHDDDDDNREYDDDNEGQDDDDDNNDQFEQFVDVDYIYDVLIQDLKMYNI